MLVVVGERRVRGTVERTYALSVADAQISDEELKSMTPEDHRRAFMAFLAGLLADFDRYIDAGDVDLEQDGAGYRTVGLWLDRDELMAMVTEIGAAVQARIGFGPGPGRTRRMLSTVLIPVPGRLLGRPGMDPATRLPDDLRRRRSCRAWWTEPPRRCPPRLDIINPCQPGWACFSW